MSVPIVSSTPSEAGSADGSAAGELAAALHELLDHVVGHVPGVVGAVVSSVDGFVLAGRLPPGIPLDAASIAAMSAALVGVSNRLLQSTAPDPVRVVELRSEGAHGYVFAVAHAATLTLLAAPEAERPQVMAVGRELTAGLHRILRG